MALTKTAIVIDGRPVWAIVADAAVLIPGPISGRLVTADGTEYDVTPDVIEVRDDHVGELAHLIGLHYEESGHPKHGIDDEPFLHCCTAEHCGDHARPITDPNQALALVRAQVRTDAIADGEVRAHFAAVHGTNDSGMSMALASAAAENAALNGLDGTGSTNVIPDVSLHTATPGTTGASETANSGSYARQACSWNAAASGSKTNSTTLTFATLGTIAVTHMGTWSSATYAAGTYAIGGALTASVTSASITMAAGGITMSAT